MAHELEVWLFADRAGTLTLVAGRLAFCYDPNWLSRPQAVALSVSLPLQAEPFDDHKTRPFFAGLLPEGQMRRLIAQQFQVSNQNDFALLDHIGGECAGAVTFLEPGQALPASTQCEDIQWLSNEEVIAILDELPHRPMLAGKDGLRLSLAGAQDKLPVVFDGARIGLPHNGTPSSHILKPPIHAVEDSVANEGFCLTLANTLQLKPAKAKVHSIGTRSFLLVERYDRSLDKVGHRRRIHQEDFCQALGVVPEIKYQNEGGPDLAQCFDLVRRVSRPSAPQVLRLLDYVIFNALTGNHDAHAKNFSLLYLIEGPVLAPFYDTLSTAVYPMLTPKMAMKIGSKYKFSEIQARHWDQLAEGAGLAKALTKKRILELAKSLPPTARKIQSDPGHGFSGNAVVERIIALIEQRCALTIRRLTDPAVDNEDDTEPSS
ncbi:type II toxin-antitoxin system HipA family toxin [Ferrovum myxofaciens]|uniref:Type II toxin-antitoxin system HipA family toxin n=1 Tax=Ferrovum myxofaciens TaxID=416213 RepID=A0A9E6SX92_9PROT|nr:type II toxin-antitoxin system HipA family toxin [Ferrovum myxofaciens]QKE39183.1 MAG: type II toxin-antitoxin system HipA family toxin [Ferrovum myxofaciens]QWY74432.1 MAG: type II toxin-antitoxin system HipA family toxin [Ferrovum myxofaciens]QWY77183.1 MAG: type II toxin-antitoxin system HipA family toxin [Ferrovum myxofaciens]